MPHMHGPVLAAVLVCNLVNRVYMDLYWPYAAEEGELFYELKFPDFLDPRRFRSIWIENQKRQPVIAPHPTNT